MCGLLRGLGSHGGDGEAVGVVIEMLVRNGVAKRQALVGGRGAVPLELKGPGVQFEISSPRICDGL